MKTESWLNTRKMSSNTFMKTIVDNKAASIANYTMYHVQMVVLCAIRGRPSRVLVDLSCNGRRTTNNKMILHRCKYT